MDLLGLANLRSKGKAEKKKKKTTTEGQTLMVNKVLSSILPLNEYIKGNSNLKIECIFYMVLKEQLKVLCLVLLVLSSLFDIFK